MAQQNKFPILTLCIPIYNRLSFLERQLEGLLNDVDLFENKVQLIISDNCSEDDLKSCCDKYKHRGLRLEYHRQKVNNGPDGNFDWCFHHADGKYVWLLGSDDIPIRGTVRKIVGYLDNSDYGLIHLSQRHMDKELTVYNGPDEIAVAVNFWITFVSASIIRTESIKSIDLPKYFGSWIVQVPAYLNACCLYPNNAIIYQEHFFEESNDAANNGGYNLFQVFVTNLYGIYEEFIVSGMLSKQAFTKILKIEYKEFLVGYIVNLLFLRKKSNFKLEGSWAAMRKYYGNKPYAYYYLLKGLVRRCLAGIIKPTISF